MENFYTVLECPDFSEIEDIRKSYLRLVKIHHPDKASAISTSSHAKTQDQIVSDTFVKIDKAWKVLKDNESKGQYDSILKQRLLCQDFPIQDELYICEFQEFDENFSYACRCGGLFSLTSDDVKFELDFVCCDSCTLCVKVTYMDLHQGENNPD